MLENCAPLVPQYGPPDPKWGLQFWWGQFWAPTTQISQKINQNKPFSTCEFFDPSEKLFFEFS